MTIFLRRHETTQHGGADLLDTVGGCGPSGGLNALAHEPPNQGTGRMPVEQQGFIWQKRLLQRNQTCTLLGREAAELHE